jgi:hypothetical protein
VTNRHQADDTYAERNNDVEGPVKTCARFLHAPARARAGQPFAITGLAQVGISGLKQVQYWIRPAGQALPAGDPYLAKGDWRDATVLPPPQTWGSDLPDGRPPPVLQADPQTGQLFTWPIPNTIVHWAALADVATPGTYELRCRTVDANGIAQPLPRPFGRSGVNTIDKADLAVED